METKPSGEQKLKADVERRIEWAKASIALYGKELRICEGLLREMKR